MKGLSRSQCLVWSCVFLNVCLVLFSCGRTPSSQKLDVTNLELLTPPAFNSDSAYNYIAKQLSFGPRVPNMAGHVACGDYLVAHMRSLGFHVIEQEAELTAYNGEILKARNIITEIYPEKRTRIMLCAHWDSRPYADYDPDNSRQREAILGADDGASGVGVLMEIARALSTKESAVGVDIIFFDAEDYGQPIFDDGSQVADSWCLGSQYWAKHLHRKGYHAKYGILLDMVGSKQARFSKEYFSSQFAGREQKKIWQIAQGIGYGEYFVNEPGNPITDDHYYVNTLARIPCVNIINLNSNTGTGFGKHWHTHADNLNVIDKHTLKVVGETVLQVIFSEQK